MGLHDKYYCGGVGGGIPGEAGGKKKEGRGE